MEHTPGPWKFVVDPNGKFGIYPEGGTFLAVVDTKANARLIAQAPAMREFLESIVDVKGAIDVDDVNTGHNASYRDMARALLAAIDV